MPPEKIEPEEPPFGNRFAEGTRGGFLRGDQGSLFCVQPAGPALNLAAWGARHTVLIDAALRRHGAILFRGFDVRTESSFREFIQATSTRWAEYREPATPRTHVGGNIYTSTEYPCDHEIPLHNENSHCTSWPLKIYFYCVTPAASGGQTPIADCRRVLSHIPANVVARFKERRWLYVRNFGSGLGFPWQKVFGTHSRSEVGRYCAENSMGHAWGPKDSLRVSYIRDAVRIHPVTAEELWFNHGLFFNPVSMEASLREMLLESFAVNELPYNTFYGDGEPVEPAVLNIIRDAYRQETRYFSWQPADVLMADNMLMSHGRKPYAGARKILVGMTDAYPA